MKSDMALKKEDHEKYISLEMNLDDISLLSDLLKIETIFQIKRQVAIEGEVEERTASIINTVTVFQEFDTQLKDLKTGIVEFKAKFKKVKNKPINMIVISVNRAKIYHFLCTKTTELDIPENVKEKAAAIGSKLAARLEEAISSEPIFDNSKKSEPVIKPDSVNPFKINMLGQKGQA